MGIWSNLCRLSASVFSRDSRRRAAKGKPETSEHRGLRMEQFEDRVMLSVSPSSTEFLEALRAYTLESAISSVSNLSRYTDKELASVDGWIIGLKSDSDSTALAHMIGADNLGRTGFMRDAFVWEFSTDTSWRDATARLNAMPEVEFFYPLLALDIQTFAAPDDPLFADQWHLQNNGNLAGFPDATSDINVVDAWDYATGAGVTITIIDGGVEFRHEDLSGRYLQVYSWDYIGGDNDPSPGNVDDNHGTAVAGLALASAGNGLGGVGVAYNAEYAAIRLIGGYSNEVSSANALGNNIDVIDIFSNSWGPGLQSYGIPSGPGPLIQLAIEAGIYDGRDGLGCIYVFAAGNELQEGGDANYNGYANSIYTIAVAATDQYGAQTWYSSRGACIFISAPASGEDTNGEQLGVTTTDRTGAVGYNAGGSYNDYMDGNYTKQFNGTSAATPIVSGVIALMLEANPSLTYRDVQYILQETAVKTDPTDAEWVTNGAGNWVNPKYGFGLIDAAAAVQAARTWSTVAPTAALYSGTVMINQTIPDNNAGGIVSAIEMGREIGFIEQVEVKVNIPHMNTGDLEIILVSPAGTESYLAEVHNTDIAWYMGLSDGYNEWTFSTVRCWGESSGGQWQLIVRDRLTGDTGIFVDWSLTIHGTEGVAGGPSLMAVFPSTNNRIDNGDILTIGPTELTLRFTFGQRIDPATLGAITVWRAGNDGEFVNDEYQVPIGYIGVCDNQNEVVIRFAETLVNDQYQIRIHGKQVGEEVVLANIYGTPFGANEFNDDGKDDVFEFELDLGPVVTTVIPMPTVEVGGQVIQYRDQVDVYFNNDQLDKVSAENTAYYQLIFTKDTADTNDDVVIYPISAIYTWDDKARVGKVVLKFDKDLSQYGEGSFRLRLGEEYREYETAAPVTEVGDTADSFADATNWTTFGNRTAGGQGQSLVINGTISPFRGNIAGVNYPYTDYNSVWPGGNDEPGHRLHPTGDAAIDAEQHIMGWDFPQSPLTPADLTPGITLIYYHFPVYKNGFYNFITPLQKEASRQILAMLSQYMGIQFVEVGVMPDGSSPNIAALDIWVADLAVLGGESGPGGVAGLGGGMTAVLDLADFGDSADGQLGTGFTSVMMHEIMHNLGFGHTYDLDAGTIMGDGAGVNSYGDGYYNSGTDVNAAYPGNNDITHGQYLYRLDGMDIDLHKFTLNTAGKFSAEIVAERLVSNLNAVLILFDAKGNVIARNDDYFSNDPFMELDLEAGTYYIGVSSVGNDSYDPTIANSGMYGRTEGAYQLRLNYMPVNNGNGIKDIKNSNGTGGNLLDGDQDGIAGGVYNTWFDVRKMSNTVYVDKDGRTVVGMAAGAQVGTQTATTTLDSALKKASFLVTAENSGSALRILGNNFANDSAGAYDGSVRTAQDGTLTDNKAYEIGWKNTTDKLSDGNTFIVPQGVNVTIDAGVVFKLRQANIEVGSRDLGTDLSHASLQVLGTPYHPVYFTSYNDEATGVDSDKLTKQTPELGDWGGIVFRNKVDYEYNADRTKADRVILENEGIFLNTVAFADIRFGGGRVDEGGESLTSFRSGTAYEALYMQEARPTLVYNLMVNNARAAMSADPNSFKESTFHDSSNMSLPTNNSYYTADYNRVGPHIRGNIFTTSVTDAAGVVTTHTNTLNGIQIRITTAAGKAAEKLSVTARFDDYDIVHILTENLTIAGNTTGALVEFYETGNPQQAPVQVVTARPDGGLHIDAGVILKVAGAMIDVQTGAHIIAEASATKPIIITSVYDDRYGAGGVFDLNNNKQAVVQNPGDWGGIYLQPDASGYFDHVRFMYAGGTAATGGEYHNFNTIEARQAFLRVTNSVFEGNDANAGFSNRLGYGIAGNAVINIMNAQPIIVNNQFLDNNGAVISINANSMWASLNQDPGRATGSLAATQTIKLDDEVNDQSQTYKPIYSQYADNSGPLVRENRMKNNDINGMIIRGETLTTECTWDDTDITHVVFNEITIPNFHTYGGLRLKSSSEGSLVVKFSGANAGISATGSPADIDDRIGGRLQVIGMPNYPVIMTSLSDDTVGAGRDLNGRIYYNTNNSKSTSTGTSGDWRGILFDSYSNDRNVETVIEIESASTTVALNDKTSTAQYIGALAGNINSGDENLRLGFEIHGSIQTGRRSDVDVYAFRATPGQEIWIDIDETDYNLDTKIELIDSQGNIIATSVYSVNENERLSGYSKAESTEAVNAGVVNRMNANAVILRAMWTEAYGTAMPAGTTYATLTAPQVLAIQKTAEWKKQADLVKKAFRNPNLLPALEISIAKQLETNTTLLGTMWNQAFGTTMPGGTTYAGLSQAQRLAIQNTAAWGAQLEAMEKIFRYANFTAANTPAAVENGVIDLLAMRPDVFKAMCTAAGVPVAASYSALSAADKLKVRETKLWEGLTEEALKYILAEDNAASMETDDWTLECRDYYAINLKDAGMRVVLPGALGGSQYLYYLRVTSNVPDYIEPTTNLNAGQTGGRYQIQVRLQEKQEIAGSMISYADIRYAVNGITVKGMPVNSPLTNEVADIDLANGIRNDTIGTAQKIGNVLETNRSTITVTGSISDVADVDWYQFDVNIPGLQMIPGVTDAAVTRYPIEFDIDYADGMGRPDVDIWVFDAATGQLVLSGSGSNLVDDMAATTGVASLKNGSYGTNDATIGPIYLPVGSYYIAVALAGRVPAIVNNSLIRAEPVESLIRIVEDHLGDPALPTTDSPAAKQNSLNVRPEAYSLSDVVMYICQGNDLISVNPFTGQSMVDWTSTANTLGQLYYGDIYMRNDGRMFTMPNLDAGGGIKTEPQFIELSLADARIHLQDHNAGLDARLPANAPTGTVDAPGHVVTIEALVSGQGVVYGTSRLNRGFYAVGYTPASLAGTPTRNLLWAFDDNGNAVAYPVEDVNQDRVPTNPMPLAQLYTSPIFMFENATDTQFIRNTDNSFLNPGDIHDGSIVTVRYSDMDNNQFAVNFEFDSGYDLALDPWGVVGPNAVRDGDTFTITMDNQTYVFEFDSDSTLVIPYTVLDPITNTYMGIADWLQTYYFGDGNDHFMFSIFNEDLNRVALYEFIDGSSAVERDTQLLNANAVPVDVGNIFRITTLPPEQQQSAQQLIAAALVTAINGSNLGQTASMGYWDVNENNQQDINAYGFSTEPQLIMISGRTTSTLPLYSADNIATNYVGDGTDIPGIAKLGDAGVAPGNTRIYFDPMHATGNYLQAMQVLGEAIVNAINNHPALVGRILASYAHRDGEQFDGAGNASIYNRTVGDRITISGVTPVTVNVLSRAATTQIISSGINNDFYISGMDPNLPGADAAEHSAGFFNGVTISFVMQTGIGAVGIDYTETRDPVTDRLLPGNLVITYDPALHTAATIVAALNAFTVTSTLDGVTTFNPFQAGLLNRDTNDTSGNMNNGSGLLSPQQPHIMANGSRGTRGLTPNVDFNGDIAVDGVATGNYRVRFGAAYTFTEMAAAFGAAINNWLASDPNAFFRANLDGNGVALIPTAAYDRINFLGFTIQTRHPDQIVTVGAGTGGDITGLAWLHGGESADELYAVDNQGGLYHITGLRAEAGAQTVGNYNFYPYGDPPDGVYRQIQLKDNRPIETEFIKRLVGADGQAIAFTSLSNGPQHVENGAYRNFLFGIAEDGYMYCFDTQGNFQNVFYNGKYAIYVGAGVTGLSFSPIDFNLWSTTTNRGTDEGHGVNPTYTNTRNDQVAGGLSMYYGMDTSAGPTVNGYGDVYVNYSGTNPDVFMTYETPGGNSGSLVTDEFSLQGYSAGDQPFMTFNYFLETEGAIFADTFRVYIMSTDPAVYNYGSPEDKIGYEAILTNPQKLTYTNQIASPGWTLLASNNDAGVQLVDNGGGWYQCTINLAAYAGLNNIKLRFVFSTSGIVGVGDTATVGDWLYTLPGYRMSSGDTFTIGTNDNVIAPTDFQDFEFLMGHKVLLPGAAGTQLKTNDYISIVDKNGTRANFIFAKDGATQTVSGTLPGTSYVIPIRSTMSSVVVADLIRQSIAASLLTGIDASDVTVEDTIIDEQNIFISGAANVMVSSGTVIGNSIPSVDGEAQKDQTNTLAMETTERIQFTPFQLTNATLWTAGHGYSFTVADRYGNSVTYYLMTRAGVVPPGMTGIRIDQVTNTRNGIAGDIDGDRDFDSQDLVSILAMYIADSVNGGALVGLTAYATGDCLMIKGSNYVVANIGGPVVNHTWKSGGDTLLNPEAFPIRSSGLVGGVSRPLTFASSAEEFARAIALAMENCYNSYRLNLGAPGATNVLRTNDTFIMNVEDGVALNDEIRYIIQRGNEAVDAPGLLDGAQDPTWIPYVKIVTVAENATTWEVAIALRDALNADYPAAGYLFEVVLKDGVVSLVYTPGQLSSNVDFVTIINGVMTTETLNRLNIYTSSKYKAGEGTKVNIIGSVGDDSRVLMSGGPLPFTNKLMNDAHVYPTDGSEYRRNWSYYSTYAPYYFDPQGQDPTRLTAMMQGQGNRYEGAYVDDIIIGFRERGVMYTGSPSGTTTVDQEDPDTGEVTQMASFIEALYQFVGQVPADAVKSGEYQLQIRRASDFGYISSTEPLKVDLMRAFDTNERFAQELSLQATQGSQIAHLDIFTISDGTQEVQFQFVLWSESDNVVGANGYTAAGAIPIFYYGTESQAEIAQKIVSAVNKAYSIYVSGHLQKFNVRAYIQGDGGTAVVNLVGAAQIKIFGASLFEMIKHNDDTNASYQLNAMGIFLGTEFTSMGDQNTSYGQGLIYLNSNMIAYSKENGIQIITGERDMMENYPHPGTVANLTTRNSGNLVSGVAVINNIIAFSGNAGIYMNGDDGSGSYLGARLFSHVANNTIWGTGAVGGSTGIHVGANMAPTLLNNVIANNTIGINVEGGSWNYTVIGHNAFSRNLMHGYVGESYILVGAMEPLFVSPNTLNFYPVRGSKIIDAARDSLEDRVAFANLRATLGIEASPIIAPILDIYGQTRTDDPGTSIYVGGGMTSFKDIGAVDRVDFEGPWAELKTPNDNGSADMDPLLGDVALKVFKEDSFKIQLYDNGVGINDAMVTAASVQIYQWPSNTDFNPDDAVLLRSGVDYIFDYDRVTDLISLYPVTGTWRPGVRYQIVLSNSQATDPQSFICDLAGNELQANRPNGNAQLDALFSGTTQFWVYISGMDWGDAPDPTYPSLASNNGACHIIVPGFHLGPNISSESDARQNKDATGDTYDDGVFLPYDTQMKMGSTVKITVNVTADDRFVKADGTVGYVNAWIDFAGDGGWDNGLDYALIDYPVKAGDNIIEIWVPDGVLADGVDFVDTFARFRLTTYKLEGSGVDFRGEATDGEVEDYAVRVVRQYHDYGDAPRRYDIDPGTGLLNPARHIIDYDANGRFIGPYLGEYNRNLPDTEREPQWSINADGDNKKDAADENGVVFGTLVASQDIHMTFNVQRNLAGYPAGTTVYISVWMDYLGDGTWVPVLLDYVPTQDGQNRPTAADYAKSGLDGTVPLNALEGATYARVRITTEAGIGPIGEAKDGEVEDYLIYIVGEPMDWGDAPNSYGTMGPDGAHHRIWLGEGGYYLGIDNGDPLYVGVDHEIDGQPSVNADGDDLNGAYNDESGVSFTRLVPGRMATVTVEVTGNTGYLYGWIDYNRNGVFDASDAVIYDKDAKDPTKTAGNVWGFDITTHDDYDPSSYTQVLKFNVYIPIDAYAGDTYARFRLSSSEAELGPTGYGGFGEVEDYKVSLELGNGKISGYVFNDLNANGLWDQQIATTPPLFSIPAPSNPYTLGKGNDISTRTSLGFEFEYFGNSYREIYISTDGYVCFGSAVGPLTIGQDPKVPTIAVFWSDNNTQYRGTVSYERGVATNGNRFFMVTWSNVPANGTAAAETKLNTYVLYIENTTGGDIVAMQYTQLNWASAPAAGETGWTGYGGQPAIAGFYSGTGTFISVGSVSSQADADRLLAKTTYSMKGCHAYRFDPSTGLPGGREPGLAMYDIYEEGKYINKNIRVFIDDNDNGKWDVGEQWTYAMFDDPSTTVNELGYFEFTGLFAGEYDICMEVFDGNMWVQTTPNRTAPISTTDTMTLKVLDMVDDHSTFTLTIGTAGGTQRKVTFEFVDTSQSQTPNYLSNTAIYYNSTDDTANTLATAIVTAINSALGANTARAEVGNIRLSAGVYDLNIASLEGKIAIQSSHSLPADELRSGYYHVVLSGDEQRSGLNFGAFRKGEVYILSTEITEGNSGEKIIRVGVELTGSYGAEYGFWYQTGPYITSDVVVGYYCDENGNLDDTRPIYAGQAVAGANNGKPVGYYIPGVQVVLADGSLFTTTGDLTNQNNWIMADYRAASGYYKFIGTPQGTPAGEWNTTQITNSTHYNNYEARISGNRIVYVKTDQVDGVKQPSEVFVYDHTVGSDIWSSGNQVNNNYADISGDWIVWSKEMPYKVNGLTVMYYQLFAYNLETNVMVQLTDNTYNNINARISDGNVIWEQQRTQANGVKQTFLMTTNINGDPIANTRQIYQSTDIATVNVDSIRINTSDAGVLHAVWTVTSKIDNTTKVWYYDGVIAAQVTPGGNADETRPELDNGIIVFQSKNMTTKEENIYYFIIGQSPSSQLLRSTGSYGNINPQISNGIVVWEAYDRVSLTKDIFYCDLNTGLRVTNITNSPEQDTTPVIFGNRIAWRGEAISLTSSSGFAWDIFFYEIGTGTISRNITQDDRSDSTPMISEDMIVWRAHEEKTGAYQIFVATQVVGRLTEYIEIVIYGDTTIEEDEMFALILQQIEGGNVIIRDGRAVITILNDDGEMDFGEADSNKYPTKIADNGARHNAKSGYILGKLIDSEEDGFPLIRNGQPVTSDNALGLKDNDGVVLPASFVPGSMATIKVTVTLPDGVDEAKLDAWIDFNHNGSWDDGGDQILNSYTIRRNPSDPTNNVVTVDISILVPRTTYEGETWSRFRLSANGGLAPTGYCSTGEVEDYKVTIARKPASTSRTLIINGSEAANDAFVFRVINDYKQFEVTTSTGTRVYNVADYDLVTFDGMSTGGDSFHFVGGSQSESMYLWPNQGYIAMPGLAINIVGVNAITVDGNGGADRVDIYGSYRNDVYTDTIVGGFREVKMTEQYREGRDAAYSTYVRNLDMSMAIVSVYAGQGGYDTATVNSILAGDVVRVEGENMTVTNASKLTVTRLYGFENIIANDTTGKASLALYGTGANDTVVVDEGKITLNSLLLSQELNGFTNAAIHGSNSNAVLHDTQGDDMIVVSPNSATMTDSQGTYNVTMAGFAKISALKTYGGTDSVTVYGSEGDDTLVLSRQQATMYGQAYSTSVSGFQIINAYAGEGGNNVAKLYDAEGENRVVARGLSTEMYGLDYYNSVCGFANTYVYAIHGTNNKATLYDTIADDTVVSYAEYTNMYSEDYYNQIFGFKTVDIVATAGGTNTAKIYDSAMGDLLQAGSNWASLTSGDATTKRTISDFDFVEAVAKSTGSVTQADASAIDFLLATGKWKTK